MSEKIKLDVDTQTEFESPPATSGTRVPSGVDVETQIDEGEVSRVLGSYLDPLLHEISNLRALVLPLLRVSGNRSKTAYFQN